MKILFLDCISGISGDMTVGALTDLGVPPSTFEWELSKVDFGDFHMHFEQQMRQGIAGIKFGIHEGATHRHEETEHEHHEHEHEHHEHEHHEHEHKSYGTYKSYESHAHSRNHREIRELITQSSLSPFVKEKTLAIFQRIAVAEGKIHQQAPEDVAFHEVGALDSIADIVCTCVGLEALGVERLLASKLFDGTGWLECAHGRFPIPAPATLEILAGIPLAQIDAPFEFITPTGAAILAEFSQGFGLMPELKIEKIGYGIGTRQIASHPNVLRAILGDAELPA